MAPSQMRRKTPLSLALAALTAGAALFAAACSSGTAEPARPRNVIFILVDTLRADRLGIYGYGRDTSPNVDAFARGAVLFPHARNHPRGRLPPPPTTAAAHL